MGKYLWNSAILVYLQNVLIIYFYILIKLKWHNLKWQVKVTQSPHIFTNKKLSRKIPFAEKTKKPVQNSV